MLCMFIVPNEELETTTAICTVATAVYEPGTHAQCLHPSSDIHIFALFAKFCSMIDSYVYEFTLLLHVM